MIETHIHSELHPGLVALVDDADLELVTPHAWCVNPAGYVVARVDGKVVYLHRILLPGVPLVDHANGNKLDNRRANLRPATPSQNNANQRKRPGMTSRYKGVYRLPSGHWGAAIQSDRRRTWLGTYKDEETAARAYDEAALFLFGEFARLNLVSA